MEKQVFNVTTNSRGAKKYPKTARRLRGNTLVPVVIALAISAVATVAFLQQGESLMDENNRILSINEISVILGKIQEYRALGNEFKAIEPTNIGIDGTTNILGREITWDKDNATLTYNIGNAAACNTLLQTFTKGYTMVKEAAEEKSKCTNDKNLELHLQ